MTIIECHDEFVRRGKEIERLNGLLTQSYRKSQVNIVVAYLYGVATTLACGSAIAFVLAYLLR